MTHKTVESMETSITQLSNEDLLTNDTASQGHLLLGGWCLS